MPSRDCPSAVPSRGEHRPQPPQVRQVRDALEKQDLTLGEVKKDGVGPRPGQGALHKSAERRAVLAWKCLGNFVPEAFANINVSFDEGFQMSEKRVRDIGLLDRSRSYANLAVWTISLQIRRISQDTPEDEDFIFRRWADYQFLIVALRRLRRAVEISLKVGAVSEEVGKALKLFDERTSFTKIFRDVEEHIDNYVLNHDKKHHKNIEAGQLQVAAIGYDKLEWLGYELSVDEVHKASCDLFETLKEVTSREFKIYREHLPQK
jgi:hypothetical protein